MNITKAKEYAANAISRKMHTSSELRGKLVRKGCSDADICEIIREFTENGLLDDVNYTALYIEQAQSLYCKGQYRIRQELHAKGIDREIIDDAFSEVENDDEYNALCEYVRLYRKKPSDWKGLENFKAHLCRRGFAICDIKRCIKEMEIDRFNDN